MSSSFNCKLIVEVTIEKSGSPSNHPSILGSTTQSTGDGGNPLVDLLHRQECGGFFVDPLYRVSNPN